MLHLFSERRLCCLEQEVPAGPQVPENLGIEESLTPSDRACWQRLQTLLMQTKKAHDHAYAMLRETRADYLREVERIGERKPSDLESTTIKALKRNVDDWQKLKTKAFDKIKILEKLEKQFLDLYKSRVVGRSFLPNKLYNAIMIEHIDTDLQFE